MGEGRRSGDRSTNANVSFFSFFPFYIPFGWSNWECFVTIQLGSLIYFLGLAPSHLKTRGMSPKAPRRSRYTFVWHETRDRPLNTGRGGGQVKLKVLALLKQGAHTPFIGGGGGHNKFYSVSGGGGECFGPTISSFCSPTPPLYLMTGP